MSWIVRPASSRAMRADRAASFGTLVPRTFHEDTADNAFEFNECEENLSGGSKPPGLCTAE